MKANYIKSIPLAGLLALTASCTNLDVEIKSQLTEFPNSEVAIEAKAASVYYGFRGPLGREYHDAQVFSSDEATGVSLANDYYDNGRTVDFSTHNWTADNSSLGYCSVMTESITKCNQVIFDMGGKDVAGVAPVRAIRAFYLFIFMDSFGDAPILNHLLDEDEAIDRSPRADVARFIESELLDVMDNLSKEVNSSTYGKPTYYMAQALLAKLYLNWMVYTCGDVTTYTSSMNNEKLNDVVKACDEIITSDKFELGSDYMAKFNPENGSHIKDFIYAMPYDRETQQGMTWSRHWTHRSANMTFYGLNLPNSVGGNYAYLPEFVDKFCLEEDDRNEQILGLETNGKLFVRDPNTYKATNTPWIVDGKQVTLTKSITLDPKVNMNPLELDVNNEVHGGRSQGYRSIKFYMDLKTTKAQNRNQSNDVPIFRLADILLMKAEAILRGATTTNGDTPISLINQLRDCAHAPHVSNSETVNLEYVLDERAREMADECWRRNDLIRYDKFEAGFGFIKTINPKAMAEKFRRIFPIPTFVLNSNTNWKQNSGY